jgi:hypothetical protein
LSAAVGGVMLATADMPTSRAFYSSAADWAQCGARLVAAQCRFASGLNGRG